MTAQKRQQLSATKIAGNKKGSLSSLLHEPRKTYLLVM